MGVARVQAAAEGVNGASVTVTLGTAPTAGNLLVAWANSDALVSIGGTGWTAGPVVIDGNGAYAWWKIAGAGEPSAVTFTPSVPDWIVAGLIEYSGLAAAPFDTSGSSMISGSSVTSTTAVAVTTGADHDLVVALAHLHSAGAGLAEPTAPSFSGGLSVAQSHGMTGGGTTAVYTIAGDDLDAGTAGSLSTAASWTGPWPDAQELVFAFKATSVTDGAAAASSGTTAAAAGTRAVPGAAAPASTSTSSAAGIRIARAAAAAAAGSSATATPVRTVHATAAASSSSAVTATPHAHSRLTYRPYTGTTLRP
jgi:hypothetical protein